MADLVKNGKMTLLIDDYDYRLETVGSATGTELLALKSALEINNPIFVDKASICKMLVNEKDKYFMMEASDEHLCYGVSLFQVCSDETGCNKFETHTHTHTYRHTHTSLPILELMAGPAFSPESPYLESTNAYAPFIITDDAHQGGYTMKFKTPKKLPYIIRMTYEAMSLLFKLFFILHISSVLLFVLECLWYNCNCS